MTALDTNILVYAHRMESPWHLQASACLIELAEGTTPWAIPWPCIHEFLAVVTNPRIFRPPTPLEKALADASVWMESPSLRLIGEGAYHWEALSAIVRKGKVLGPMIHDARIAAICSENGVSKLFSADHDFSRFPGVNVVNPLLTPDD